MLINKYVSIQAKSPESYTTTSPGVASYLPKQGRCSEEGGQEEGHRCG